MRSAGAALDAIERVPLVGIVTPLEDAPRLAGHAGLARLMFKRDDMTGLAMGGNKARKLEYDLVAPVSDGCDVVITVGGAQSNHAAITAAACRRLGLDIKLVLGGPAFSAYRGNLLLDVLLGAEIRYLDDDDNDLLAAAMHAWAGELRAGGRRPYELPLGGSTGAGALGYVRAMRELAAQFGPDPVQVVMAVGSCGTFAGANLGARLFMPRAQVIGISVSRSAAAIAERTVEIARESAALLGIEMPFSAADLVCYDDYRAAYGVPTVRGREAILAAARLEGVLLDPVYTGKAMAGLIDLARGRALDPAMPTIFLHTGGLPIVFAFEDQFREFADCTRVTTRATGGA